ncbi:MAG: galactokinase [Clostridiales bacterium]|nr:galactokinase [Clostridiales bacterium]
MVTELMKDFKEKFGDGGDIRRYFAPGRVNMIGEHTDYNGGHVFPCALTIGTYAIVRKRDDREMRFYSQNFEEIGIVEASLDHLVYDKAADWTNYPVGVVWTFIEKGYDIDTGFDMLLFGNIPNASGLSSSSSVEVVVGVALRDLYGFEDVTMQDIALYGQYCENNFNGVNCGIMDQFSIAMGKKDMAIFLDCSDLSYTYVPLELKDAKIVIACSNKKRGLGDSKYNERRAECEEAVSELQAKLDIKTLGELTEEEFEANKDLIKSEVRQRRAKHAVYENQRTLKAVEVLQKGDIEEFGRLMNASHVSLRDDYEVTGIELDTLVETAWEQEGVIGSRMTGAGFGGCTVSIVKEDCVESFIENVGKVYLDKIGYAADFYVVEIGDGGRVLD